MEARLLPVNGFVALVQQAGDSRTRPLLRELGFHLIALELPLNVPGGPTHGTVVADAVAWHPETGIFLVAEAKSGRNFDETQAVRYSGVTPEIVQRATKADIPRGVVPSVVVVYCVMEAALARIRVPLRAVAPSSIIVAFDQSANSTSVLLDDPGRVLRADTTQVDWQSPIPALIRLDQDSPPAQFVPPVRAELVAAQSRSDPIITVPTLAERVVPYLGFYTNHPTTVITHRVEEAARRIAQEKPDDYRLIPSSSTNKTPSVAIRRTPEDYDRRGRTQSYQALARTKSRRKTQDDPNQLDLLAVLDIDLVDTDRHTDSPSSENEGVPNE